MAGIHLHEICEKLNSQTARQRHTALADLQAMLARDDALRQLNDPSNSGLFGALLDNYAKEVAYSKRSKGGQALHPLHQSAECFKGLIEKARLVMLRRNIKEALEHILRYFPDQDEPEYHEVAPSFCASLRLIFSYPPHLEQLGPENWHTVVEFCIANVEVSNLYTLSTSQNDNFDDTQMQTDSLSMRKEIGDLILTLQSFVNYPGAPIQSIRESLVAFLLNFLASYNTVSDARLSAVISLNRVLQHISINDITLAKAVAPHVLDLVPRVWDARIPGLRERILVTISTIYPHLYRMTMDGKLGPSASSIIHKMLDVMSRETRFEDRKSGLQLDDIIITPLYRQSALWNHRPFQSLIGPFFSLNPHPTSSEFPWMILQLQSSLLRLSDFIHVEETASSQANNFERHVKRRRLDSSSRLHALVDETLSSNANHLQKLGALQKFAFCLNDFRIPNDSFDFQLSLKSLEMVRDTGNAEIVGWSLLCICCIIGRMGSSESSNTKPEIWTNIWIACVKYVAMSPTCRPASAVMEGILRKKILPVPAIVPHVKWMVEFVEQRGPANLVDNSCDFWSSLFNTLEDGGISTERWRRDALSRWILFRMDDSVTKDTLSNGERISSLFMPLLRLLTTDKWTSTLTIGSSSRQIRPQGPIGDHLSTQASNLPLLNFLLDGSFDQGASTLSTTSVWTTDLSCPPYVREFLEARYQSLCELHVAGRKSGGNSSPEELSWLFAFTVTIMLLLRNSDPQGLLKAIAGMISTHPGRQACVDSCLRGFDLLIQVADSHFARDEAAEAALQSSIKNLFADQQFKRFIESLAADSNVFRKSDGDSAMYDFHIGKQQSFSSTALDYSWALRDISRSSSSTERWRLNLLVRLHSEVVTPSSVHRNYVRLLDTQSLLLAQPIAVKAMFETDEQQKKDRLDEVLEIFEILNKDYAWMGNEMSFDFGMSLMSEMLLTSGMDGIGPEGEKRFDRYYRWMIRVVINRPFSSVRAKVKGIRLLRDIAHIDLAYEDPGNPESKVGVVLIRLLKDMDSVVQYNIGKSIAAIFQLFPFSDRVDVYHDMVCNLDGNSDNTVGFALRAFTLTHLAFAADDIRRAAMVNLLELASFREWKWLVQACFRYISSRLYDGNLTSAFLQNSSQFISSYIEFDEIVEFPYDVFGFPDFDDWVQVVSEELVAQLLNADRWDYAVNIYSHKSIFDEILREHLARIISYYYLNLHSSEESVANPDSTLPDRCKACLGADLYVASLQSDFARVLSIMTERLDDRTVTPEAFLSLNMRSASSNLSSIGLPRLSSKYPQPLPPHFPIQTVVAAMAHIGHDLGLPIEEAWTPAISIFVLRHLFDQAHRTSDSTVSLSFLRRVAFVASLASDSLRENYALEMPICSVLPFLKSRSTRGESTQILKYLLSLGKQFFMTIPNQFNRLMALILPFIGSNCQNVFGNELIRWMHTFANSTLSQRQEIEKVNTLLELLLDPQNSSADLATIFHDLLQAEPTIWADAECLRFVLLSLSEHSNVFAIPLSILERLVFYVLNAPNLLSLSDDSKRWFGLAIGRLAQGRKFEAREYVLRINRQDERLTATDLLLREVGKQMRSDMALAGLLEQSLRTLVSTTDCTNLAQEFNTVLKYLPSPHITAIHSLPPLDTTPSTLAVDFWTRLDDDVPRWLQSLGVSIVSHSQNPLLRSLVLPIKASISFAEAVLPFLVDEFRFDPKYGSSLASIFNIILGSASTENLGYLKPILEVIITIRERCLRNGRLKMEPLLDELDYLHAATAAVACSMYKTGLMFLEIARGTDEFHRQIQPLGILSSIYRNLDDPDLPYALSKGIQRTWNELLDIYTLHKDRELINGLHRARLRGKVELGLEVSSRDSDVEAVTDFLRMSGFRFESGLSESDDANATMSSMYKSAWRLGLWEAPPLSISQIPDTMIYSILFEFDHGKSPASIFAVLNPSVTQLVESFCTSTSALQQTNSAMTLSLFSDLSHLLSSSESFSANAKKWQSQILERARFGSFEEIEPSASLHNAVLKIADRQSQSPTSRILEDGNSERRHLLVDSMLAFCEMTRTCGSSDDLLVALAKTGFLEEKFSKTEYFKDILPAILTERAEILWGLNEKVEAIQSLQTLIDNRSEFSYSLIPEEVISANLAAWTAEMKLSPSDVILDNLLDPAVRSLENRSDTVGKTAGKVFFEYASFCLTQLQDPSFLEDLDRVQRLYDSKQSEVSRFQKALRTQSNSKLKRDKEKAERDRHIDEEELSRLSLLLHTLSTKAIENFLRCFASCNTFDHHVAKFCALWLKHFDQQFANHAVSQRLKSVPSYKFIPLMHQLCARLSSEKSDFQNNLHPLLLRALNDHPFHVFPQMYSTMHAPDKSKATIRLKPAKSLVDRMSYTHKVGNVSVKDLSIRLSTQYEAYSALADTPVTKDMTDIKFSSYPTLHYYRSSSTLPPPSMPVPVSLERHYSNVPSISKYKATFKLASGINLPKIVDCTLTDGTSFRELVKGGIDDLRQDAIMQQVFQEMDGVLRRNRETRRRNIGIRTYRVVPLKATTGVIQWVMGTIPVSGYLEQKHKQYPSHWSWNLCRKRINDLQHDRFEARLKMFQQICTNFHPVLRFFFLETFKNPDAWFSRQIQYSRSVAASSMIGHIVGLGDRHGHNILLDTTTGEVVHIDLGIAFEQGKLLPVGEIVPFRLTRDIVDGFGVSGCEGPFIRASTFALTVFRQEQNTIVTLLDVLKHDPLYQWTISPLKLLQVQQELQRETTDLTAAEHDLEELSNADRAINVVKRKLASLLSPEADVRRLVLEATDTGNLSRMFHGWAAFS